MLNLVKIRPVGAELFHADGRTDRTMLIIVAVRNCANAPKENPILIQLILQLLSPVILVHYSIQNVHNTSCPIKPVFTYLTTNHGKCIACLLCKLQIRDSSLSAQTCILKSFMVFLCPSKSMPLKYRGADKSLARPGRKQATVTEYFEFHISYL